MSDATERWRPVVGYEGFYEVSDLGRVRSLDRISSAPRGPRRFRGKLLRPHGGRVGGRATVRLCRDGVGDQRFIYHLVLEAFVGPRPPGMVGCHTNGDASDSRLANLRWDTVSSNTLDMVRHGTHNNASLTRCLRGHDLFPPNLRESMLRLTGSRACLACHRADGNYRWAIKTGRPADLQALSDDHFRRIMAAA